MSWQTGQRPSARALFLLAATIAVVSGCGGVNHQRQSKSTETGNAYVATAQLSLDTCTHHQRVAGWTLINAGRPSCTLSARVQRIFREYLHLGCLRQARTCRCLRQAYTKATCQVSGYLCVASPSGDRVPFRTVFCMRGRRAFMATTRRIG